MRRERKGNKLLVDLTAAARKQRQRQKQKLDAELKFSRPDW
jgi:hypothetical protein